MTSPSLIETRRDVIGFAILAATLTGVAVLLIYTGITIATGQVTLVWPLKAVGWRIWMIPPAIPLDPTTGHLAMRVLTQTVSIALFSAGIGGWATGRRLDAIRERHHGTRI